MLNKVYPDPAVLLEDLNPKGSLQEYTQAHFGGKAPVYKVLAVNGPAHDPEYTVEVTLEGIFCEEGRGSSRKNAEQRAAAEAMKFLHKNEMEKNGKKEN